jgi:hypothetical protein
LTQVTQTAEWTLVADPDPTEESSALAWRRWLLAALEAARKSPADLVRLTEGAKVELTYSTISKWTGGKGSADPERVIIVAELLDGDIVTALRAAGHELIANRVEGRTDPQAPNAPRFTIDDDLAALRASDLPPHLKLKFEHEYAELLDPMLRATEAVRRRVAAELDQALEDQKKRRSEGAHGDSAESA